MKEKKIEKKSPYNASFTGCTFMYDEFVRVLPLLMSDNAEELIKAEILNNNVLLVNSYTSRQRFMTEFRRRYASVPRSFWESFLNLSEEGQRMALFYAIMKTYKLVFDLHFNLTVRKWNSADPTICLSEVLMELNEIASRDPYVDSWTEKTKNRLSSCYLTIMRQCGLIKPDTDRLQPLSLEHSNYAYYLTAGDGWFLSACLLYSYEIENIKKTLGL